jgi:hypothetical protein
VDPVGVDPRAHEFLSLPLCPQTRILEDNSAGATRVCGWKTGGICAQHGLVVCGGHTLCLGKALYLILGFALMVDNGVLICIGMESGGISVTSLYISCLVFLHLRHSTIV